MKFENQNSMGKDNEEKILPLINVVFLLLIFFMITASLTISEPFDIEAPLSTSNDTTPQKSFRISISQYGDVALNGELLAEENILKIIESSIKEQAASFIEIKADRKSEANRVLTLMNNLKTVGVQKVSLLTEKRDS